MDSVEKRWKFWTYEKKIVPVRLGNSHFLAPHGIQYNHKAGADDRNPEPILVRPQPHPLESVWRLDLMPDSARSKITSSGESNAKYFFPSAVRHQSQWVCELFSVAYNSQMPVLSICFWRRCAMVSILIFFSFLAGLLVAPLTCVLAFAAVRFACFSLWAGWHRSILFASFFATSAARHQVQSRDKQKHWLKYCP